MSENNGVTVTLKGGVGYDAPWIVIHGDTEAEALARINDVTFANLAARAAEAASFFQAAVTGKTAFPAATVTAEQPAQGGWNTAAASTPPAFAQQPQAQYAQAAAQQAPPGQQGGGETCIHGPMKYKESAPGAAKAWKAWMCPTPKGTPGQCDPVWIR